MGAAAPPARASQFIERNARNVRILVNAQGDALVTYQRPVSNGSATYARRYIFLSGKQIGALAPAPGRHQAHWASAGMYLDPYKAQALVRGFEDTCRPYDGPPLPFLVAACKAGDGSYWALQDWQTPLPDLGFAPWRPSQAERWLHASHWRGPVARLEVRQDWVYDGRYRQIFGRYTYDGQPVYGFGTTAVGAPTDLFGRLIYLDTLGSAYGAGWRRENSFVPHNPTGIFCYGFYPFDPSKGGYEQPPGYAGGLRGPGVGTAYRLIAEGPGLTPDVLWQGQPLPAFRRGNVDDLVYQAAMDRQLAAILGVDKLCGAGHTGLPTPGDRTPVAIAPSSSASPAPAPSDGACATDVAFVVAAYRSILGRDPTAREQAYWQEALQGAAGATLRFRMTDQLASGDEARGNAIGALVQRLLGRVATAGEVTSLLGSTATTAQAIAALVASPEYASRAGTTIDTWLDKVATDLVGAPLDPASKATLLVAATGQGKQAAIIAILQSAAYRQRVVTAQFKRLLGRNPNAGELSSYAPATPPAGIDQVDVEEHVVADLVSSREYVRKALAACTTGGSSSPG